MSNTTNTPYGYDRSKCDAKTRRLIELKVADSPQSWERAGFVITQDPLNPYHPFIQVGDIRLRLVGPTAAGG
ncbi:hypothetical protein HK102_002598, partial [Quaeritorhiza haematococci]